ncbi:MAG: hypothetical protein K1W00_02770 [Lachnospiraceae bacterium]
MKHKNKLIGRLKVFFNRRRRAGFCVFFAGIGFTLLTLYTNYFVWRLCMLLAIVCIPVGIYLFFVPDYVVRMILHKLEGIVLFITRKIQENLKKLGNKITKIANKAGRAARAITKFIKNIVRRLMDKFSFGTNGIYKGARLAKGYVDVKEKAAAGKGKAVRRKKKKYKYMDNVEKVRYHYEKKIAGAVRRGIRIEESMTPNEAGAMLVSEKYMKNESMELIDKYNFARYDEEAVVTDEMVERVKRL